PRRRRGPDAAAGHDRRGTGPTGDGDSRGDRRDDHRSLAAFLDTRRGARMTAGLRPAAPVVTNPLAFCGEEVGRIEEAGLLRRVRALESASEPEVILNGRRVLCLASNNYLGLAAH